MNIHTYLYVKHVPSHCETCLVRPRHAHTLFNSLPLPTSKSYITSRDGELPARSRPLTVLFSQMVDPEPPATDPTDGVRATNETGGEDLSGVEGVKT